MSNTRPKQSSTKELELCRSWVIYGILIDETTKVQKEIDEICYDYSFYPEIEWGQYGYGPPENHQVLGAWRHPQTKVFIFLLDNPSIVTTKPETSLLLRVVGQYDEIKKLIPEIENLKDKFLLAEKKAESDQRVGERIDRFRKSKSLSALFIFLSLFTAIVNAFSLFLRKLPPPVLGSTVVIDIYKYGVMAVHFASICMLFIVITICIILSIKYGIMLIRRL